MAKEIGTVKNRKNTPPSTSGFPKAVQNKKSSNKGTVPASRMGGSKKKC